MAALVGFAPGANLDIGKNSGAPHCTLPQAASGGLLATEAHVLAAWRRYECFWLPLLRGYLPSDIDPPLAPPADVAMIWLAHLSDPEAYASDLAAGMPAGWKHTAGLAPQYRHHNGGKDTLMSGFTEKKWNKQYGKKEPWDAAASHACLNTAAGNPSHAPCHSQP